MILITLAIKKETLSSFLNVCEKYRMSPFSYATYSRKSILILMSFFSIGLTMELFNVVPASFAPIYLVALGYLFWHQYSLYKTVLVSSETLQRMSLRAYGVGSIFIIVCSILAFAIVFKSKGMLDNTSIPPKTSFEPLDALYLSAITWTTVGYGDLVPARPCRLYAATEALYSYFCMAIFLAGYFYRIQSRKQNQ